MKSVIEGYIGFWIFLLLFYLCIAFTTLNMNIVQARNILSSVKAQVTASDGAIIPEGDACYIYNSRNNGINMIDDGYEFIYTVTRCSPIDTNVNVDDSAFIYNYVYRIDMTYKYKVPVFGYQIYPLSTTVY